MNKERLIEYVYQEMSASERKDFEALPENVQTARQLSEIRAFLRSDKDEQPGGQPIFIKPRRRIIFSKWWAIAAGMLMLLFAGRLLDVRIEKADQSFTFSYGGYEKAQPAVQANYDDVLASMASLRYDLNKRIDGLHQNAVYQANQRSTSPNDQTASVNALKRILARENSTFAEELTQQLKSSQQAYTLEVVNTLLDYWDGQRKQDLEVVNTNLQNLAQTIQLNSDEFAQFTNQTVQNY